MSYSAHEIAAKIGRPKMAESLDVGMTAISKYCVIGKFPAGWLIVVRGLCEEINIECPENLFDMKKPAEPNANGSSVILKGKENLTNTSSAGT